MYLCRQSLGLLWESYSLVLCNECGVGCFCVDWSLNIMLGPSDALLVMAGVTAKQEMLCYSFLLYLLGTTLGSALLKWVAFI